MNKKKSLQSKEAIENKLLSERTGGYHHYQGGAKINNPDPTTTYFISGLIKKKLKDSIRILLHLIRCKEKVQYKRKMQFLKKEGFMN